MLVTCSMLNIKYVLLYFFQFDNFIWIASIWKWKANILRWKSLCLNFCSRIRDLLLNLDFFLDIWNDTTSCKYWIFFNFDVFFLTIKSAELARLQSGIKKKAKREGTEKNYDLIWRVNPTESASWLILLTVRFTFFRGIAWLYILPSIFEKIYRILYSN